MRSLCNRSGRNGYVVVSVLQRWEMIFCVKVSFKRRYSDDRCRELWNKGIGEVVWSSGRKERMKLVGEGFQVVVEMVGTRPKIMTSQLWLTYLDVGGMPAWYLENDGILATFFKRDNRWKYLAKRGCNGVRNIKGLYSIQRRVIIWVQIWKIFGEEKSTIKYF